MWGKGQLVEKSSYRGTGTRGRPRGTRVGKSLSEGDLTKQKVAVKTIKEQRKERYSMYQNLCDSKAVRDRVRRERIARGRILMPVDPRKQLPRHVAAIQIQKI